MQGSGRQWKPGQSGNPGGMTSEVKRLTAEARLTALKQCPGIIEKFIKCIDGSLYIDKDQFKVMRELLDRGMGKPLQTIELPHDPSEGIPPIDMNTEQLKMVAANHVEGLIVSLHAEGKLAAILERLKVGATGQ